MNVYNVYVYCIYSYILILGKFIICILDVHSFTIFKAEQAIKNKLNISYNLIHFFYRVIHAFSYRFKIFLTSDTVPRKSSPWKRGRSRSRRTVWVAGEYGNRAQRSHPRLNLFLSKKGGSSPCQQPNSAETVASGSGSENTGTSSSSPTAQTTASASSASATTSAMSAPRRQRGRPRGSKKNKLAADGGANEQSFAEVDAPPPPKTRALLSPAELSEMDKALLLKWRSSLSAAQQTTNVTLSSVVLAAPSAAAAAANRRAPDAGARTSTNSAATTTPKERVSSKEVATPRGVEFSRQESVASVSSPPVNLVRNLSDLKSLTISGLGDGGLSASKSAQLSASGLSSSHLRDAVATFGDFSDLFSGGCGPPSSALALLQDLPSARIPLVLQPAASCSSSQQQQSHASAAGTAPSNNGTGTQLASLAISVPNPIQASNAVCNSAPLISGSSSAAGGGGVSRAIGLSFSPSSQQASTRLQPPASARIGIGIGVCEAPASARLSSALPIRKRILLLEHESATLQQLSSAGATSPALPPSAVLESKPVTQSRAGAATVSVSVSPVQHTERLASQAPAAHSNATNLTGSQSHATKSPLTSSFTESNFAECAISQHPHPDTAISSAFVRERLASSCSSCRAVCDSPIGMQQHYNEPQPQAQPQPQVNAAPGSVFEVQLPTLLSDAFGLATAARSCTEHAATNGTHSHYLFVQRLNDIRQALSPPEINFFLGVFTIM